VPPRGSGALVLIISALGLVIPVSALNFRDKSVTRIRVSALSAVQPSLQTLVVSRPQTGASSVLPERMPLPDINEAVLEYKAKVAEMKAGNGGTMDEVEFKVKLGQKALVPAGTCCEGDQVRSQKARSSILPALGRPSKTPGPIGIHVPDETCKVGAKLIGHRKISGSLSEN
jgi:hypothetical protein